MVEGSAPPGWYPDPDDPSAASLRYWDGANWTEHRAPARTPAPRPAPRPLNGFAWLAVLPTVLWGVAAAAVVGLAINYIATLGPFASIGELTDAQDGFQAARTVMVLLGAAASLLLLPWFYRAYVNVESAGAQLRFGTGWSVGAWFIPFFNLIRCKQIANDISRGSTLDDGLEDISWRDRPYDSLLNVWWTALIASALLFTTGEVILGLNSGENILQAQAYVQERTGAAFEAAGALLYLVTAALVIAVIRRITAKQDSAARDQ
jgi:hypothetical protein